MSFEVVGTFAVLGFLVVPAAAGKVGRGGMIGAGQRAVADAISVNVLVAGKAAEAVEIFLAQHFAALDRLLRILEGVRHPVVHAEIKIGHHEDQGLELLRQIEGIARHGEALLHGTGEQQDVLGVAVGEKRGGENVALRGARGQTGGRTDALDVPDHAGNFRVVGEAGKFCHERNARAGGRGHGARPCPSRAQHHADRGQFVFGLHDGERGFAVGANAEALHVFDHALGQRR